MIISLSQNPEDKWGAISAHLMLRDKVHTIEDRGQRVGVWDFTGVRFWNQLVLKLTMPETFRLLNIL